MHAVRAHSRANIKSPRCNWVGTHGSLARPNPRVHTPRPRLCTIHYVAPHAVRHGVHPPCRARARALDAPSARPHFKRIRLQSCPGPGQSNRAQIFAASSALALVPFVLFVLHSIDLINDIVFNLLSSAAIQQGTRKPGQCGHVRYVYIFLVFSSSDTVAHGAQVSINAPGLVWLVFMLAMIPVWRTGTRLNSAMRFRKRGVYVGESV